MHSYDSFKGLLSGLILSGLSSAAPAAEMPDSGVSCNTPSNRACWQPGFDINTDYEDDIPDGKTVVYTWNITEVVDWVGPDGHVKPFIQLVNDQYPGPTVYANWGDTIVITVNNQLPSNGTSFHWHGVRNLHGNLNDGSSGVTECPIPPNHSKTYTFRAWQYGTSWYHSHTSAQYGNGLWGSIQIEGPASSNYDVDLGVFPINDYNYRSAEEIVAIAMGRSNLTSLPPSENVFFNGTNIHATTAGLGRRAEVTLTKGKRHRLRIINPSFKVGYQVSLVGHKMTVIATDFVPVKATHTVDSLFLAIGQRYDVVIDADADIDNYWFNVTLTDICGKSSQKNLAAIFRYEGVADSTADPTDPGVIPVNNCQDDLTYKPVVSRKPQEQQLLVDAADLAHNQLIDLQQTTVPFFWMINGSSSNASWEKPLVQYVLDRNTSYPRSNNLIFINDDLPDKAWTYWVISTPFVALHPLHLHGHDFLVLGSGANETFSTNMSSTLNFDNPVRRDTTMLPPNGWLVLAFRADNPGNWLFHCHIAYHSAAGLNMNFMERPGKQMEVISQTDLAEYNQNCKNWNEYAPFAPSRPDSGFRRLS